MSLRLLGYEKYHFFWSGPFSQWYKSRFVIEGVEYVTAEQFMMAEKARLFGDVEQEVNIMRTSNPREQKHFGRLVRGFDQEIWVQNAKLIVYRGSFAKFTQNSDLYDEMMKTTGKLLVEASPSDKIWGIGLAEDQASVLPPDQWQGTNWLGEILTMVREDIR